MDYCTKVVEMENIIIPPLLVCQFPLDERHSLPETRLKSLVHNYLDLTCCQSVQYIVQIVKRDTLCNNYSFAVWPLIYGME